MVAIGSVGFASSFTSSTIGFIGWARMIGNSEAIEVVMDSFSQHYSNQVDNMVEDLGDYDFSTDYHMNLNFAKGPKAYLDVGPMVYVMEQKILAHHLHLSLGIQLEDAGSPYL